MSKTEDLEEKFLGILITKKKQELDEEYKNLSWAQAGYAAVGVKTGNKKYDDLNKEFLDLNKNNPSIIQTATQAVEKGASALQFTWEAAQALPDLITEFNNLKAATNAATDVDSINAGCKIIQDAAPLLQKCVALLNSETISESSKETIMQYTTTPYLLTPILNNIFGTIIQNSQTAGTENINILADISPRFIRELSTLGVDILSKSLEGDLNSKMQEIYKNIKEKNDSSQVTILKNIREIITSNQVNPLLEKNLVNFLKNPDNQKELVQFIENITNNQTQKFANPELIANTATLLANSSESLIKSAPLAIDALNQLQANQTEDFVKSAKEVIDNLSPILKTELPKYLETNNQNILDVLNHSKVTEKIISSGQDPEFIYMVAEASMPFVQDALPSITKLVNHALSDSDKAVSIIEKATLINSLPEEEKKKKVQELITALIEMKNNNPEIKTIVEKDIPKLLTAHAETLGPVIEEFLNKTPIGQKLKLEGEKLVKIAGNHTPELIKIADKFNKREYGKMIIPALKMLADPKVVGLVAKSIVNLGISKFSKNTEPVGKHTHKISKERNSTVNKQTGRGA